VGIGALFGGIMTIINPNEPLGMSVELLKNSPFKNYLIPGIILFTLIGLGNVISAIALRLKFKYLAYTSNVFSWALVFWIIIQCIMIQSVAFLHVLFLFIGLVEAALAMTILFRHQLFPANIIIKVIHGRTKN
jgi:hypothetical protein